MKHVITLLVFVAVAVSARADVVSFENDNFGFKPNGWMSAESNNVLFYDTVDADLQVDNFGLKSFGRGLAVFDDDASALRMVFAQDYTFLSLAFGNDVFPLVQSDDWALLTLFKNGSQVGSSLVQLNANGNMDQTISWSGGAFDAAEFVYVDEELHPLSVIEVVDNITFSADAPVPEPSTVIGGIALAALAFRRAARRKLS